MLPHDTENRYPIFHDQSKFGLRVIFCSAAFIFVGCSEGQTVLSCSVSSNEERSNLHVIISSQSIGRDVSVVQGSSKRIGKLNSYDDLIQIGFPVDAYDQSCSISISRLSGEARQTCGSSIEEGFLVDSSRSFEMNCQKGAKKL